MHKIPPAHPPVPPSQAGLSGSCQILDLQGSGGKCEKRCHGVVATGFFLLQQNIFLRSNVKSILYAHLAVMQVH